MRGSTQSNLSPRQGLSRAGSHGRAGFFLAKRGRPVRAGDFVLLLLGAANRDPEQFPDPDRLHITRREVRHLAFAHGPHFCLGAPLARLEGQIALRTLLDRFPNLRLATTRPEYRENFNLRGLKSLPVVF